MRGSGRKDAHKTMPKDLDYDSLNDALCAAGSAWDAAGAHGLLAGRLAVLGAASATSWQALLLEGAASPDRMRETETALLGEMWAGTYRQLAERLSEFEPLLPADTSGTAERAAALGRWCEAFLHGLVSVGHDDALRKRLAAEPVAGIIRDMLQITRATADGDGEEDERAFTEIVEYLRVATQLIYEEFAELRPQTKQ